MIGNETPRGLSVEDFFCIHCGFLEELPIFHPPPDFIEREGGCPECKHKLYAYSPPPTIHNDNSTL